MKRITLQDLEDFEYELAHLQNKYGIFLKADFYEELDEDIDGNYGIVNEEPYIEYVDIKGNTIYKHILELERYILLVSNNEEKIKLKIDEIFNGQNYELIDLESYREYKNEKFNVTVHGTSVGGIYGKTYGRIFVDEKLSGEKYLLEKCKKWIYKDSSYNVELF